MEAVWVLVLAPAVGVRDADVGGDSGLDGPPPRRAPSAWPRRWPPETRSVGVRAATAARRRAQGRERGRSEGALLCFPSKSAQWRAGDCPFVSAGAAPAGGVFPRGADPAPQPREQGRGARPRVGGRPQTRRQVSLRQPRPPGRSRPVGPDLPCPASPRSRPPLAGLPARGFHSPRPFRGPPAAWLLAPPPAPAVGPSRLAARGEARGARGARAEPRAARPSPAPRPPGPAPAARPAPEPGARGRPWPLRGTSRSGCPSHIAVEDAVRGSSVSNDGAPPHLARRTACVQACAAGRATWLSNLVR